MMENVKRKHFTYEDRVILESLINNGYSYREISKLIHKSISSISYEIYKNSISSVYNAKKANHKAYIRRYNSKKGNSKLIDIGIMKEVRNMLNKHISPERISGYFRKRNLYISKKCIYRYVKMYSLEKYLIFKGKKRSIKIKYEKCIRDMEKRRVDTRPPTLCSGHYEGDFIVSSHSKYSLLVICDRVTKYSFVERIENRKHATVLRALCKIFDGKCVKSLTLDNDISFSNWKQLEKVFNTKIYFCYPYHSWEKGLVENTNRWIRIFVPKGLDLKLITEVNLKEVREFLNYSPRQILNYDTPAMLYLS